MVQHSSKRPLPKIAYVRCSRFRNRIFTQIIDKIIDSLFFLIDIHRFLTKYILDLYYKFVNFFFSLSNWVIDLATI